MTWIVNQQTGIGTDSVTGKTMAIQAPNPNVDKDGKPLKASTPSLALNKPSPTATSTHTLKAYDANNNYAVVYVVPGQSVSGISLTPKASNPAPAPTNLNTNAPGNSGVNKLFEQYYGRPATTKELAYWVGKSDADLRPKLILNSAVQLAKNKPATSTGTKLPSGVLVKDTSNGKVYFIDGEKKLRYITNPSLIAGKDVVDVDHSHLDLPIGANIDTKPVGWDFPSGGTGSSKMTSTGINWSKPRGYNPTTESPSSGTGGSSTLGSGSGSGSGTGGSEGVKEKTWKDVGISQELADKFFDAFGRYPKGEDLDNFNYNSVKFEEQVDNKLKEIGNITASKSDEDYQKKLDRALTIINNAEKNGTLPPDIAELWRTVVKNYPKGMEFEVQEVLNSFDKIKKETIDPYFNELVDLAKNDVTIAFSNMSEARKLELEAENENAKTNLENTKGNLEASGMTFSGEAVKKLGGESAIEPQKIPFGGAGIKGSVNQSNRLIASSTQARYKENLQNLGRTAENMLGTAGIAGIGIPFQSTGVVNTGSLSEQKQGKYASTLQELINQYKNKQSLLTNT